MKAPKDPVPMPGYVSLGRIKKAHKLSDTMIVALCSARIPSGYVADARWPTCKALEKRGLVRWYPRAIAHGLTKLGETVRDQLLEIGVYNRGWNRYRLKRIHELREEKS